MGSLITNKFYWFIISFLKIKISKFSYTLELTKLNANSA